MCLRILFTFPALFSFLLLSAQKPLPQPLAFLPGDSVVTWSADLSDFRSAALAVDPTIKEQPATATRPSEKAMRNTINEWAAMVTQQDIVGGNGEEDDESRCLAAARLIETSSKLFLQTGEARFVDAMERPHYNLLPAVVGNPHGEANFARHFAAQTLFNAAGVMYATDNAEALYVNYFMNSTTRIVTPGLNLIVDQLTAMPHDGRVKIRFSGYTTACRIRLYVRIPSWACDSTPARQTFAYVEKGKNRPEIYVNGRDVLQLKFEKGYAVIDRKWNSGDEVMINFPLAVQHLRTITDGKLQRGMVALQRGPLVYAVDKAGISDISYYYSTNSPLRDEKAVNAAGHTCLSGHVYEITHQPMDKAAQPLPISAEPYMDNRGTVWLKECK